MTLYRFTKASGHGRRSGLFQGLHKVDCLRKDAVYIQHMFDDLHVPSFRELKGVGSRPICFWFTHLGLRTFLPQLEHMNLWLRDNGYDLYVSVIEIGEDDVACAAYADDHQVALRKDALPVRLTYHDIDRVSEASELPARHVAIKRSQETMPA